MTEKWIWCPKVTVSAIDQRQAGCKKRELALLHHKECGLRRVEAIKLLVRKALNEIHVIVESSGRHLIKTEAKGEK